MPAPLHTPWAIQTDRSNLVLLAFCGAFASAAVGAVLAPSWFWLPLAIVAAAAVGVVAFRHTIAFCVAWLLLAGATLEMTLADLVGPAAFGAGAACLRDRRERADPGLPAVWRIPAEASDYADIGRRLPAAIAGSAGA